MAAPIGVDEYMAALPEEMRAALEQLRQTIRSAAPEATETISYRMPAFKVGGRVLVYYAAFKKHCSLFPASGRVIEDLRAELEPFEVRKGTIRFRPDAPLPAALVERIVAARMREIEARAAGAGGTRVAGT